MIQISGSVTSESYGAVKGYVVTRSGEPMQSKLMYASKSGRDKL